MNQDNTKKLVAIYPKLFSDLHPMTAISLFGFDCGDGWFEILKECIENIAKVCEQKELNLKVSQVKEKYGSLRFYMDEETDEISHIIQIAEAKSAEICEECGQPGEIRAGQYGWYNSRCDKCYCE